MNKDKLKKKVIKAAVGAGTVASLITASKYSDPKDLIKETKIKNDANSIKLNINIEESSTNENILNKIPVLIRALLLLPLWIIGTLIIKLFNKIVSLIGMPILCFILKTLFIFLILLMIVILFIKLLYPNKSLKEILTKSLIIRVFISSFIVSITDTALNYIIDSYEQYRTKAIFIIGLIVLCLLLFKIVIKKLKEPIIKYGEI